MPLLGIHLPGRLGVLIPQNNIRVLIHALAPKAATQEAGLLLLVVTDDEGFILLSVLPLLVSFLLKRLLSLVLLLRLTLLLLLAAFSILIMLAVRLSIILCLLLLTLVVPAPLFLPLVILGLCILLVATSGLTSARGFGKAIAGSRHQCKKSRLR